LGELRRLERLNVEVTDKVPGVLYPSHFTFLRARSHGRRDGIPEEPVFCPRLQSLRIRCKQPIAFGKARGEALKAMRPNVAISFE
ncbi:hypothetical protein CPB97_001414, partial [Podila verticillata]